MDYSISWAYIVSRMESLYGISPNNEKKVAMGDIKRRIYAIWEEYFVILYNKEKEQRMRMKFQNIKEDDEP